MASHFIPRRALRAIVIVSAALLLSACGSTGVIRKGSSGGYDRFMADAETHVKASRFEAALDSYAQAAKANPSRKEPWVRSAQLYFDTGNFSRAIIAADEALARDPRDVTADSVLTVSGFRVASQSLQRLQNNGGLRSEAARSEAQQLAAAVRSLLSDAGARPTTPPRPSVKPQAPPRRPAADAPPRPKPPADKPENPSSDPFDKLGGGR
jgi:tetratricopeptide (TPR) repeat protein